MRKRSRLNYGWIIVGISFITLGLSYGIWYSFSVCLCPSERIWLEPVCLCGRLLTFRPSVFFWGSFYWSYGWKVLVAPGLPV